MQIKTKQQQENCQEQLYIIKNILWIFYEYNWLLSIFLMIKNKIINSNNFYEGILRYKLITIQICVFIF